MTNAERQTQVIGQHAMWSARLAVAERRITLAQADGASEDTMCDLRRKRNACIEPLEFARREVIRVCGTVTLHNIEGRSI